MALTQKTIQSNDLNLVVSSLVMKNLYANTATPVDMNKGVVNANYQGDARNVSQVGVTRFQRLGLTRRILGSATDGNFVSTANPILSTNDTLALTLLNRIDPIIQIPQAQQGMLNYSIAEEIAYNISGFVGEQIDKDTLDEIYTKAITFGATLTTPYSNVFKVDLTTAGDAFAKLQLASNYLTNLPANNYDTSAPARGRVQVVRELVYQDYISSKGVTVVGSDLGLKTLVKGVEGYTEDEIAENSAWRGVIFGINTYIAPDTFFPTPVAGKVYGIVSHPMATTRAMHTEESRVIPSPTFLGDLYQCAYQYGILCTRPHMVAVLASTDWANA
jgi:hypothetical protein